MTGVRTADGGQPVVLVVEDDRELLELNARRLQGEYEVLTAADGEAALETMTDAVDIVVLDRRMPGLSGDELLAAIRRKGYDCHVTMLTGVDPDYDIIDMGFDDYIIKPVTPSDLRDVIERLLILDEYDETYQRLSEKRVKQSVLAAEKSRTELRHNEEFARLQEEITELERELESIESEIEETPLPH